MSNKFYFNQISKTIVFFLLFLILCSLQTIWWNKLFGSFPAPHLWLTLIVFFILRWPLYAGIFFSYFLGFNLIFYTFAPLKMIWISLNLIYIMIWSIKNRINSTSLILFGSLSAFASILFSFLYVGLSKLIETNPTELFLLHRLTECGLTFLFSLPLYFVFTFIEDFFTAKENWRSQGSSQNENQEHLL